VSASAGAIHVALAPFPAELGRRERVTASRRAAAAARLHAVQRAGAPPELGQAWPRDEAGAPAARAGWHASFADTAGLAAALVARVPAALDVEWLGRPRWQAARARFAEEGELARLGADDRASVLALWTAKEAVLKLARVGLADLARCPLVARTEQGFVLWHRGSERSVRVLAHGAHVLAVACESELALELSSLAAEPAEVA